MNSIDILKKKVTDLENLASEVEDLGVKLLQGASVYEEYETDSKRWKEPSQDLKIVQRDAVRKYQRWYNSAYVLIKEYIPQKEQEFLKCYEDDRTSLGVIDMLQLRDAWWVGIYQPVTRRFTDNFEVQRSIILSVPDVADVKELNLRRLISADVARTEIEEAEVLFSGKHHRAAGSVAGIALELHLKTQCDLKGVSYKSTDTLDPLATALYTAGELDKTELKHIQYLASIRNKCSHPDPVTEGEVKALIDGVKKII